MKTLYMLDTGGEDALEEKDAFLADESEDEEERFFAERLVDGVMEHRAGIDEAISKVADNWAMDRMATVDRNVLRLATFELLHCEDIPPKVSINEAIDIGKRYSTHNSGAFINGILDRIKRDAGK
jgi:N utilization substance protein B